MFICKIITCHFLLNYNLQYKNSYHILSAFFDKLSQSAHNYDPQTQIETPYIVHSSLWTFSYNNLLQGNHSSNFVKDRLALPVLYFILIITLKCLFFLPSVIKYCVGERFIYIIDVCKVDVQLQVLFEETELKASGQDKNYQTFIITPPISL